VLFQRNQEEPQDGMCGYQRETQSWGNQPKREKEGKGFDSASRCGQTNIPFWEKSWGAKPRKLRGKRQEGGFKMEMAG